MEDTLTNSIPKDKKTSDEKTLSNKEDLDKIQSNENSTNDDIESLNGDQNISRFQKDGHNVSKKDHILSIINAVVNYINTLVGAGIIALPITFALAGIVFSILISLVCALLIFYTADLMIKVSLKLKKTRNIQINSYSELAKATIGSWSQHLVTILILLLMFFLMSIYAIILRKSVKSLIEDFTGKVFRYDKLVLLAIIAPVFLLCVQRNIKNLGYTSSLSACLVVFFMIVIIIRSPYYNKLMNELTPKKMLRNEKKLNIERMQWLCMKIQKNVNLYQPNAEDRFNIAEANNYNLLYSNLKFLAKDDCERVDADKMQNTLDNLLSIPTFSPYSGTLVAPVPTKFKEVVSQAHSQNLFVEYSLFGAKKRAQTISDALSVLGVYISAFIIQQAVCSLFLSLEIRTITNWRIVQTAGMLITYCLCMGVALAGYLGQKDIIGETVFDKMKIRYFIDTGQIDYVVNAGRIALCVTIALTFPMMFFYAKKNVLLILFALLDVIWGIKANKERPEAKYFYPVTVGLFVLVLIFGLFVDKIIVVFSVIGTLLAAPIIYIIPIICYFRSAGRLSDHFKRNSKSLSGLIFNIILPIFTLIFGVFATIVGTVMSILTEIKKILNK